MSVILKAALEQLNYEEFFLYEDVLSYRPSLRHKMAMKKIFKIYSKNKEKLYSYNSYVPAKRRLNRKSVIIIAMVVFLAVLAGCGVAYFVSNGFRGEVHNEFTKIFAINTEGCPTTIENVYYLSEIPEGFNLVTQDKSSFMVYYCYKDSSGRTFEFAQYVKTFFKSNYNTEYYDMVEVDVNGSNGVYIDFSGEDNYSSVLVWENEDYILELTGNISKIDMINLSKTVKF